LTLPAQIQRPARLVTPGRWAALAAFACGIHCILTPLMVAALPILAVSEATEWGALVITVSLGGGVTLLGPARDRSAVVALLATGAGGWCLSLLGALQPLPETVTSPVGSLIFAAGMLWSARICRSGACKVCERDAASGRCRSRTP